MVETEEIKRRVSLRSVLERDGVLLKKSGPALVACCPVHLEKSPSFHVHEAEGGDWFKCFGCGIGGDVFAYMQAAHGLGFREAAESLAAMAGMGGGAVPAPLPKRDIPADKPVDPLDEAGEARWKSAAAELYSDAGEVASWADWRGIRPAVIEWASRALLCGRVIYMGGWREAFLIRRVDEDGVTPQDMGWHVRIASYFVGEKASWRYVPGGVGAWPFVVLPEGGIEAAKYIFVCEGQWDALALIDLMGWEAKWPGNVAVFGMRGASSWKHLLNYRLRNDATAFLIADRDEAGKGWFVSGASGDSFSRCLAKRVRFVYGFWPAVAKDLNDAIKGLDERGRRVMAAGLRSMVLRKRGADAVKKITFFSWCRKQKDREDVVGEFVRNICVKGALTPKGRVQRSVWARYMRAFPDFLPGFNAAWKAWGELE